jgi:hypothetical protein
LLSLRIEYFRKKRTVIVTGQPINADREDGLLGVIHVGNMNCNRFASDVLAVLRPDLHAKSFGTYAGASQENE